MHSEKSDRVLKVQPFIIIIIIVVIIYTSYLLIDLHARLAEQQLHHV